MEYEWDINEINGLFMGYGNFTGICRISSPGSRIQTPVEDFCRLLTEKSFHLFSISRWL